MAIGEHYGFKLTGVTIPGGTTSINAAISDGTTTDEYTLTGSVYDGFSGTGASLNVPVIKLDDNSAVITADSAYEINAEVSAWLENLTLAGLERNDIYVNGNRLPYNDEEGVYLYIEGEIMYAVVPPPGEGERAMFEVINEREEYVPGTYHLVIYDGSSAFNLTIDALTEEDVGNSYSVSMDASQPTPAFVDAIKKALNIPTENGTYELTITDGVITWSVPK